MFRRGICRVKTGLVVEAVTMTVWFVGWGQKRRGLGGSGLEVFLEARFVWGCFWWSDFFVSQRRGCRFGFEFFDLVEVHFEAEFRPHELVKFEFPVAENFFCPVICC